MSKNRKPRLVVYTDYKSDYWNDKFKGQLPAIYETSRIFLDMVEAEESIKRAGWNINRVVLEDMDMTYPEERIQSIKNLVIMINEHCLNVELYTNDITTIRVINNCILAFQAKENHGYPKLDPKYVEVKRLEDGVEKEDTLKKYSLFGNKTNKWWVIDTEKLNLRKTENRLLMETIALLSSLSQEKKV